MTTPNNVSAALRQIYQLIKTGDNPQAKKLLAEFLKANPQSADGWYLASLLTDNPNAKMQALERALAINPQHKAATNALMKLWPDVPEQTSDASNDPFAAPPVADSASVPVATDKPASAAPGNREPLKLSKPFIYGGVAAGIVVLVVAGLILSGSLSRLFVAFSPTDTPTLSPTFTATDSPTQTPLPTQTPTPRSTATPKLTATRTNTRTPTTTPFFRIGPALLPSKTPLPPAIADPIVPFGFNVIDAAYSKPLNRIVMVSSDPNQLHIFDPATDKDVAVDLEKIPLVVAVKPEGDIAAVGHDKLLSIVDLRAATVIKTINLPFQVIELALDSDNYAYTASDLLLPWVIDVDNSALIPTERVRAFDKVRPDNRFRLHPSGQYLYGVYGNGLYKLTIGPKPNRINAGPTGDMPRACGDLWLSEDGKRIFTQCGAVYRASEDPGQDMSANGSLKRNIYGVIHARNAGKIIALSDAEGGTGGNNIRTAQRQLLAIYNYEDLQEADSFLLPKFVSTPANGQFIFLNSNETDYYVIVRADKDSGLLHDFGLVKRSLAANEVAMDSTAASTPEVTHTPRATRTPLPTATQTLTPSATFTPFPTRTASATFTPSITPQAMEDTVTPFAFSVLDAEFSKTLNRIVMISESPNRLHIYNPTNNRDTVMNLDAVPICVSLSPNGKLAAIGFDKRIVLVDVQAAKIIKTLETPAKVYDVVLAGNGFVYLYGYTGGNNSGSSSLSGIKIDTGEALPVKGQYFQAVQIRLHQDGNRLYAIGGGHLSRIDIFAIPPMASPSIANWGSCNNFWFSEDGKRIFAECGVVVRASQDSKLDMTANGSLVFSGTIQFSWMAHVPKAGLLLALPRMDREYSNQRNPVQNQIAIFDYESLTLQGSYMLPKFVVNADKTVASRGRFVFASANGAEVYIIVQAEERSGLLNDFGLVKSSMAALQGKP